MQQVLLYIHIQHQSAFTHMIMHVIRHAIIAVVRLCEHHQSMYIAGFVIANVIYVMTRGQEYLNIHIQIAKITNVMSVMY